MRTGSWQRPEGLGHERELTAHGLDVGEAEPDPHLLGEGVQDTVVGERLAAGQRGGEGTLAALPGEEG
ncbi:MAG: hypothetical protein ACK40Z_11835, partial [Dietzia sp.]